MKAVFLKEQARKRFLCMLTLPQLREELKMVKMMRDTARSRRERLFPTVFRVFMYPENSSKGTQW